MITGDAVKDHGADPKVCWGNKKKKFKKDKKDKKHKKKKKKSESTDSGGDDQAYSSGQKRAWKKMKQMNLTFESGPTGGERGKAIDQFLKKTGLDMNDEADARTAMHLKRMRDEEVEKEM